MAAVLERELAAYQRALDDYSRDLATYNRKVSAYSQSVVRDASGNVLVRMQDGTFMAAPPEGGKLIAANMPQGFGYESEADALGYDPKKYTPTDSGTAGVQLMRTAGGAALADPGAWGRTFDAKNPGLTAAQARMLGRPTEVDAARGLIADVIRGNGINVGYNYMGAPNQNTATPLPNQRVVSAAPVSFTYAPPPPAPVPNPVNDVNFAVPSGNTTPAYPTSTPGTPQFQQDLATYLGNSFSQNASQATSSALATEQERLSSGYYNMPTPPAATAPAYTPPAPVYTPPAPVYTPPTYDFNYAPAGFEGFYFGY